MEYASQYLAERFKAAATYQRIAARNYAHGRALLESGNPIAAQRKLDRASEDYQTARFLMRIEKHWSER